MSIGTIRFLGAARAVTDPATADPAEGKFLIDCGFVQGASDSRDRNREPFAFDPKGSTSSFDPRAPRPLRPDPRLAKEGFRGRSSRHGDGGSIGPCCSTRRRSRRMTPSGFPAIVAEGGEALSRST